MSFQDFAQRYFIYALSLPPLCAFALFVLFVAFQTQMG